MHRQYEGGKWGKMKAKMVVDIAIPASAEGHLRRLDMRRDLEKVADLVELCFYDTLDPEGKQYLKEMRRAAQNTNLLGWASSMIDEAPMPPSGFVWEEDGRLVGNLSLIPINLQGKRGYMIANVATHPEYRGRGIAKALTLTALDYARSRNAVSSWLQVRDDNPSAIHIYKTSGFKECFRRSSWYSGPNIGVNPPTAGIKVGKRRPDQWPQHQDWLKRIYPPDLEWNLPFDWNLFRVDIVGRIYRLFNLENPQHWSVENNAELKGILTWRHIRGYTDPLWLATPEQVDEEAILVLLSKARTHIKQLQPLSLNYPAGAAVDVLRQAGFYLRQTLIWMEYKYQP
jgi:ribosomal protein S18 acetylase RimI-like enzyme